MTLTDITFIGRNFKIYFDWDYGYKNIVTPSILFGDPIVWDRPGEKGYVAEYNNAEELSCDFLNGN